MAFSKYKNAFKRMLTALDPVCSYYNRSKLFFVWDAFKCCIRYGVTPNEYIGFAFYKKSHLEKNEFYTARHHDIYEPKFNDQTKADIFNKKEITLKTFKDFVRRDWIFAPDNSIEEIKFFIENHNKMIVKPNNLSSGRGIHVLNENDNPEDLIKNKCLIEEFVVQHPSLSKFNKSSVNTIRIYSVKTAKRLIVNVIKKGVWQYDNTIIYSASIRVGGAEAEVDNFHAGGVAYPIDVESGVIKSFGKNILGEKFSVHPSSGIKMIGCEIPKWTELLQYIYDLNQIVDSARLIAWDIAVTEEGFDLIEANYEGDPGVMQSPSETGFKRLIKEAL